MEEGKSRLNIIDAATNACAREADDAAAPSRWRRPVPDDFKERYAEMGWEAKDHYGVRTYMFVRWIEETGPDDLKLARMRFKEARRAIEGRARRKRYHMGMTMTPVGCNVGTGVSDIEKPSKIKAIDALSGGHHLRQHWERPDES